MSLATPSVTLLAPVDAVVVLTAGRNDSGFSSGHQPKKSMDNDPSTWWQPDTFGTSALYFDLSGAVSVDTVAFWLHDYNNNYQDSKSWRVSYSSDDITYTPLTTKTFNEYRTTYTPIVIDNLAGGPILARYWKLEFIGFSTVPQDILPKISCVWFMDDYSLPWKQQRPDTTTLTYYNHGTEARSGHRFSTPAGLGRQRVLQRNFVFTDETSQWENIEDAYTAAKGRNLPVLMQTEFESDEYYALLFDRPISENRTDHDFWEPQVVLREIGHIRDPHPERLLSELPDTIALWDFRGDGVDSSSNGNDLTNSGYVAGDFGFGPSEQGETMFKAQAGDSWSIASGSATDLDFGTSDFTIEAWILMSSTLTGSDRSFLAKISFGPTTGWALTHDASYQLALNIGDGVAGTVPQSNQPTNDDTWHLHTVVVNRTADTVDFYLDGVFLVSRDISSITGNISNAGQAFSIGAQSQSDVIWWDEICITKRTLSATEILNRYTGRVIYGSWGM